MQSIALNHLHHERSDGGHGRGIEPKMYTHQCLHWSSAACADLEATRSPGTSNGGSFCALSNHCDPEPIGNAFSSCTPSHPKISTLSSTWQS